MCCKVLLQLTGKIEACYLTQLIEETMKCKNFLSVSTKRGVDVLDICQTSGYLLYISITTRNAYCCIHHNPYEPYPRVHWDSAMIDVELELALLLFSCKHHNELL